MSDEAPRPVTPNQIVAYNMARYRKAAGLTQDELGERLAGWTPNIWSKAGVSAVERSWDGRRLRQFDADIIYGLSVVLGVPITAFYLPPEVDDRSGGYTVRRPHAEPDSEHNMREYTERILPSPIDSDDAAAVAYRERLSAVLAAYRDGHLFLDSDELMTERQLLERLGRLHAHRKALQDIDGDIADTVEALHDRLYEMRNARQQAGDEE